jgi:hypothetical protein
MRRRINCRNLLSEYVAAAQVRGDPSLALPPPSRNVLGMMFVSGFSDIILRTPTDFRNLKCLSRDELIRISRYLIAPRLQPICMS